MIKYFKICRADKQNQFNEFTFSFSTLMREQLNWFLISESNQIISCAISHSKLYVKKQKRLKRNNIV